MSNLIKKALDEIENLYFAGEDLVIAIDKIKKKYSGYLNWRSEIIE